MCIGIVEKMNEPSNLALIRRKYENNEYPRIAGMDLGSRNMFNAAIAEPNDGWRETNKFKSAADYHRKVGFEGREKERKKLTRIQLETSIWRNAIKLKCKLRWIR